MAVEKIDIARASAKVQEALADLDVDILGVASLDDMKGTRLEEQALKLLPTARSIVVMAAEIYPEFLDLTSPERVMGTANLNDLLSYHMEYVAGRLNRAAYDVARASRQSGLKALPLPGRHIPTDRRTLTSVLSYKHAAEAAGLGHLGMSSLLVTYKFGPRVRLSICLTEAALKSTAAEDSTACRYCNICISKCPSGALDWPEKDEPYTINKFACRDYTEAAGGCSECIRQCPVASPIYE